MSPSNPEPSTLLKLQIGPVQEFISQARSTRDLWSGSYLLSWLMATGIKHLRRQHPTAHFIFPNTEKQPLLQEFPAKEPQELLTPNLSNVLLALLPGTSGTDAAEAARSAVEAIRGEWKKIADAVWAERSELNLVADEETERRFNAQVERHLSISWLVTPLETAQGSAADCQDPYLEGYHRTAWHLDAVRQTRDFRAWSAGGWELLTAGEKDSLSGREEAVAGGKGWTQKVASKYSHLFRNDDYLGAVSLIKRVWHLAYLKDKEQFPTSAEEFQVRSTRAIANRDRVPDHQDDVGLATGEKYLAAIAFDGDAIGKWLDGEFLLKGEDLRDFHERFSKCLSAFALRPARKIVEAHEGFLIYAGGDDVVALVPAEEALVCARDLRAAFREATASIRGVAKAALDKEPPTERPDASAGIAVAHFKFPLQDLIREAQAAERRAKNDLDRRACAVTLLKRSGETVHWGARWDEGGLDLYNEISSCLGEGTLSARFPHRVCELMMPYLAAPAEGRSKRRDVSGFHARAVIRCEFAHVLERQGKAAAQASLLVKLDAYLDAMEGRLANAEDMPQHLLKAVVGLCQCAAFIHRNRGRAVEAAASTSPTLVPSAPAFVV